MKFTPIAFRLAACLVLLSISAASLAHGVEITLLRNLHFGYMRGAPDTYSQEQTGLVVFRADRPVEVIFTAQPFRYMGSSSQRDAALDVTYWVQERGNLRYRFRPGDVLKLHFNPHHLQTSHSTIVLPRSFMATSGAMPAAVAVAILVQ